MTVSRPNTDIKPEYVDRACLNCDGKFVAESPYLRMCQKCRGNATEYFVPATEAVIKGI